MRFLNTRVSKGVYLSMILLAIACGKLDTPSNSGSGSSSSLIPGGTTTTDEIFSVTVGTIYEGDPNDTVLAQGSCAVSKNDSTPKTCSTISIPEGELYYGKLILSATITNKSKCAIFTFQPYYYQMSASADFKPSDANSSFAALDCSASSILNRTPAGCFSGPATQTDIISNLLVSTGVYYLPFTNPDLKWKIKSANKVREERNFSPGNRWTTNILSDPTQATTNYIANSMQDYQFTCDDIFSDEQYSIILKIADLDGIVDHHLDWN